MPEHTTLHPVKVAKQSLAGRPVRIAADPQGGFLIAEAPDEEPPQAERAIPWLTDDLASTLPGHREKLLEKWKSSYPHPRIGSPLRFLRFADPDGDGVFDAKPLAAEPFKPAPEAPATAICCVGKTVLIAASPNGWAVPAPDGKPTRLLDGFGLHTVAAGHGTQGLALGPDGRLYGVTGDQGFHFTVADGSVRSLPDQGCAFRMELDGSGFEIFHRGLRNPRGIVFDASGNAFTVDEGSGSGDPPRLIYLVEGGDSGWRLGYWALAGRRGSLELPKSHPQPWDAERLWEAAGKSGAAYGVPPVAHLQGNPVAITVHPGAGLLENEAGRILVCDDRADPSMSGILSLSVVPDGAGMKLADTRHLAAGLTATEAVFTWDGRLLIADGPGKRLLTLDAGERTFEVAAAKEAASLASQDFDAMDSKKLAGLLKHADLRIRLLAEVALSRKADALAKFGEAIASSNPIERRHGIWGTGILARCGRGAPFPVTDGFAAIPEQQTRVNAAKALVRLLNHTDAEVRAEALRMLADGPNRMAREADPLHPELNAKLGPVLAPEELPLAALLADESPRVRYFAAIAIGNLKAAGLYGAVCDFLTSNNNADPYLRHAGAFALQHMVTTPLMLTGLENHASPAVRLAGAIALRGLGTADAAAFINDRDQTIAEESVRSVTDLDVPESRLVVGFLLDEQPLRKWSPFAWRRIVHNAFRAGGPENAARLLKLAGNPSVPEDVRLEALRLCRQWKEPAPVNSLTGRWSPLPARDPAEMKSALTAELARLAKTGKPVRDEVEKLAKAHELKLPEPPAATPPAPGK